MIQVPQNKDWNRTEHRIKIAFKLGKVFVGKIGPKALCKNVTLKMWPFNLRNVGRETNPQPTLDSISRISFRLF